MALINQTADVPNATAPRAWSADLYDYGNQEMHTATMTCGSRYYILRLRTMLFSQWRGLDCRSSNL